MSLGEAAYLCMVLVAFIAFAATVGIVSWWSGRSPKETQSRTRAASSVPTGSMQKAA